MLALCEVDWLNDWSKSKCHLPISRTSKQSKGKNACQAKLHKACGHVAELLPVCRLELFIAEYASQGRIKDYETSLFLDVFKNLLVS